MLCRRKIELHKDRSGLPLVLIPKETLLDCGHANQLLARAQAQAEKLLRQAQEDREVLLEQTRLEFQEQAQDQLNQLEREHQTMCDDLEHSATLLVNQAIRCLLEETPPIQRVAVLLKQLLATQMPPVKATLLFHPQDRNHIEPWMNNHQELPWTLRPDDMLETQKMVLETEEGDFRIDWDSMLATLSIPEAGPSLE